MVCVTWFLTLKASEWEKKTDVAGWGAMSDMHTEGYVTYVKCQAALYLSLWQHFISLWEGVPAHLMHMQEILHLQTLESLMIPQLQSQNVQKFELKKICHVFNNLLYGLCYSVTVCMRWHYLGCGSSLRNSLLQSLDQSWSKLVVTVLRAVFHLNM